jgi:hypothetical protein
MKETLRAKMAFYNSKRKSVNQNIYVGCTEYLVSESLYMDALP